jgi:hypothetical protein
LLQLVVQASKLYMYLVVAASVHPGFFC